MSELRTSIGPDDHVRGTRQALSNIVQYGDFECPASRRAFGEIQRVLEQLGAAVQLVFRHFPLTQLHPHALRAAEAAEAAAAQGRFWEMHDALFRDGHGLDDDGLFGRAEDLGLNLDRFTMDLRAHRHQPKIQADFMSGVRSGVNRTPCFFIDGARHEGLDALSHLETAQVSAH